MYHRNTFLLFVIIIVIAVVVLIITLKLVCQDLKGQVTTPYSVLRLFHVISQKLTNRMNDL